jgi:two-component system phosphate regulon sensor histidine kinase PhoR
MARWWREIVVVIFLLLLVSIISFFTGHYVEWLLLVTVGLLVWQTFQVNRLERRLNIGKIGKNIQAKGIWEDIYYHLYKIKKAEVKRKKKLGRMIDQFRKSTNALPDAAVVLSKQGEIEWLNKSARSVLGLKKSDKGQRITNLIRMPIFVEYFHANDYDKKITMVAPADENSILQIAIVPYGASGLRLLLAQDITQLKKMERIRKDFVANVSHELRTPLTVLKGYLETLQDMEKVSPILMRSLQQMEAQTNRMQVLVDDLLMLTRLETRGKRTECVNVLDLLQSIVRETEAERIKLTIDTVSKLQGDPEELRSAFGNLIENALKYSAVETTIKVRWYKVKNYACFEVEDKGEGITKQEIPRITERFYRADVKRMNKIDGTGLGLAIVKHVLVRHEAKLQIYSEVDKGSCFQCIFPKRRLC